MNFFFYFNEDTKANLCFTEIEGDLFQVNNNNVSIAHCVSTDMEMSQGIAVEFKQRFGRVDELLSHCECCNNNFKIILKLFTKVFLFKIQKLANAYF